MTFYAKKSGSKVLRYVDGFAGQGEYESGQYGSPVIALKVVNQNNSLKNCGLTFEFLFFEETPERFSRLEQVIASISYPPCIIPKLECGKFETKLNTWLDLQKTSTAGMAPTFVFVDPFGPAGFSMELMNRILQFRSTEVLVTIPSKSTGLFHLSVFAFTVFAHLMLVHTPTTKISIGARLISSTTYCCRK